MSESLMQASLELATIMGLNALRYFKTDLRRETKEDGTPVTIADKSSETLAREWIERRYPRDGILGEEFGERNPDARRKWIIDPIDGTKAFVRSVPFWGCLVAIADGDDVVAGAAAFPAMSETLAAATGEGCWWNTTRCSVSAVSDIAAATVLTSDIAFRGEPAKRKGWNALAGVAEISRTWGDCVGYLLVATGRAEVMVDPVVAAWDIAALMPAITEAGGAFTDWSGKKTPFGGSAIATNGALATKARDLLNTGPTS